MLPISRCFRGRLYTLQAAKCTTYLHSLYTVRRLQISHGVLYQTFSRFKKALFCQKYVDSAANLSAEWIVGIRQTPVCETPVYTVYISESIGSMISIASMFIFDNYKSRSNSWQWEFNNNNELYLHGHKRDLQHCKSILTITITKSKSNKDSNTTIHNRNFNQY